MPAHQDNLKLIYKAIKKQLNTIEGKTARLQADNEAAMRAVREQHAAALKAALQDESLKGIVGETQDIDETIEELLSDKFDLIFLPPPPSFIVIRVIKAFMSPFFAPMRASYSATQGGGTTPKLGFLIGAGLYTGITIGIVNTVSNILAGSIASVSFVAIGGWMAVAIFGLTALKGLYNVYNTIINKADYHPSGYGYDPSSSKNARSPENERLSEVIASKMTVEDFNKEQAKDYSYAIEKAFRNGNPAPQETAPAPSSSSATTALLIKSPSIANNNHSTTSQQNVDSNCSGTSPEQKYVIS